MQNSENIVLMNLKDGKVIIELLPELAPNHASRIKELISEGFYDGLDFHRVIKEFMAQTGDPTGTGYGGSGQKMADEISGAHHVRGMVSMANSGHNTDDSQFFITFTDCLWLDDKHTIFGRIASGMEHVDNIKTLKSNWFGTPYFEGAPDKILSMKLLSDNELQELNFVDTGPTEIEYLGEVSIV